MINIDSTLPPYLNLQNIFGKMPAAIALFQGEDHRLVMANDFYFHLFNIDPVSSIGCSVKELFPHYPQSALDHFHQIYHSGNPHVNNEYELMWTPEGRNVPEKGYFSFITQPILNNDGLPSAIMIHGTNVTELVVARRKLKESEEILEEKVGQRTGELEWQKQFSDTIINSTQDLIVVYDHERRIMVFNKSAEQQFNKKEKDILGKTYDEVFPNLIGSKGHQDVINALNGEEIRNEIIFSKGSNRYYQNHLLPLRDKSNKIYAVLVVAHDISTMIASNEELKRTNEELASFAYISSHDLQEPLRKIQLFSKRIAEKELDALSKESQDYFVRMDRAAQRMQQLINDLLTYSRTNASESHFEVSDLNLVLDEVRLVLSELVTSSGTTIESGHLPSMKIIPFQFKQLFTNLITNSVKFVRTGEKPHIKITYDLVDGKNVKYDGKVSAGTYHHFCVRDNGIGFDQKFGKQIFGVFQRLHNKSEYEGTGIGLAIVQKIVDNHKGMVSAHSAPNSGAEFNIYIPVA